MPDEKFNNNSKSERLNRKARRAPTNRQKYCPLGQNEGLKKLFLIKNREF